MRSVPHMLLSAMALIGTSRATNRDHFMEPARSFGDDPPNAQKLFAANEAKVVKETRQLRRARERAARKRS